MSARKSKVAKARAALQSRLATVPAKIRELDQATALMREATRREHELIEARANELVEHLRVERGVALGDADRYRGQRDAWNDNVQRQRATIHRLGTEVEYQEGNARTWRNVALALGTLAIIFGGLLGNQLL